MFDRNTNIERCADALERLAGFVERFDDMLESASKLESYQDLNERILKVELYKPTIDILIDWMRDETRDRLKEKYIESQESVEHRIIKEQEEGMPLFDPDEYDPTDDWVDCPMCAEKAYQVIDLGGPTGAYQCYPCNTVFPGNEVE